MSRWIKVHRVIGGPSRVDEARIQEALVNLDDLSAITRLPNGALLVWNQTSPRIEWVVLETFDGLEVEVVLP